MSKSKSVGTAGQELGKSFDVVFEFFCEIAVKIIGFTFKTIGCGIKLFWNKKTNKSLYILLAIVIIISVFIYITHTGIKKLYVICPVLIFLFTLGFGSRVSSLNYRKSKKIFERINFKEPDGTYPKILKIQKFKDKKKREMFLIKTCITHSKWMKDKELLEQAFNSKLGIRKTSKKQIIKLYKLN